MVKRLLPTRGLELRERNAHARRYDAYDYSGR